MDISVQCGALVGQLSQIVAITSRKTALPVLTSVLVEAAGTSITLSATDLEVSATVTCPAQVAGAGRTLMPAKRLVDIAKLLPPDAALRLIDGANGLRAECGRYASRLSTMSVADFPAFPQPTKAEPSGLTASSFSSLVRKVKFAIIENDTRYYLDGAFMTLTPDGRVVLMATDGHRFAIASSPRPAGPDVVPGVLIPGKALNELASMFDEDEGEIAFVVEGSHLRFSRGPRLLLANMIDGKFPAVDRVLAQVKNHDKIATVDRDSLLGAVRRVALAASEANSRSVAFTVDNGVIGLSASSAEIGDATEEIEAKYDGPKISVRLMVQYLMDFLDVVEAGPISIDMKDDRSAVLCRREDASMAYRYILMPMVL